MADEKHFSQERSAFGPDSITISRNQSTLRADSVPAYLKGNSEPIRLWGNVLLLPALNLFAVRRASEKSSY